MKSVTSILLISLIVPMLCDSEVDSPSGKFKGHILKTRNGRNVLSFQGIPYAQPPTGSLRYKNPVKKPKMNSLFDATDGSKECSQPLFNLNNSTIVGSEDCLYLNVYIPKMEKVGEKLPVFIWIHGGGYIMGSGSPNYFGPDYFLDKDMILVTINYRLDILGFLSTGDEILPGNLGLKDQIMALKWVKENIESFGGDQNSITIGGQSAGASSVTQLMHSKLSKGLFHRVIAQSGAIDCLWSTKTKENARGVAEKFAKQSGCPIDEHFVSCLQQKSAKQLLQDHNVIKGSLGLMYMDVVPVIEDESTDAVLSDSSIKEESTVPLLIGLTSRESGAMPFFISQLNKKYSKLSNIMENYQEFISALTYNTHPDAHIMTDKLIDFYFGKDGITDDSQEAFTNMIGDTMFNYPVNLRARRHKGKTFMYMFSYKGNFIKSPFKTEGIEDNVEHAEELHYMFNITMMPQGEMSRRDREISDVIVDSWYNFIQSGDPTPQSKVWKESEGGTKYLDITNGGLIMKENMFEERMRFLSTLDYDVRPSFRHDEL